MMLVSVTASFFSVYSSSCFFLIRLFLIKPQRKCVYRLARGRGQGGRGQGQGSPPEVSVMNAYEHVPLLPPANFLFVLSFSLSVLCCAVSALTASPSHAPHLTPIPSHSKPRPLPLPPAWLPVLFVRIARSSRSRLHV